MSARPEEAVQELRDGAQAPSGHASRFGWLRHAFAVDPPGPAEPTPEQREAVEWICRQIVDRRMSLPGLMALEVFRPLGFLSSQAMHFAQPAVWAIAPPSLVDGWQHVATYLEQRGAIEWIAQRVESLQAEADAANAARSRHRAEPPEPPDPSGPADAPAPPNTH